MKKLAILFGLILTLVLGAVVVVPFFIDVDQYRSKITEAVNSQINGKLEIGKLSLSLWGQIKVEVASLKLTDSKGNPLVSVKDAYFHLPFMPLLSGSPILTFKMNHPSVQILRSKSGQVNLMTLLKQIDNSKVTPPGSASSTSSSAGSGSEKSQVSLPGFVARARLGVELRESSVSYTDQASGLTSEVKDLNLILKDVSLSHPIDLELWADLDTRLGKTFLLKGPTKLLGRAQLELKSHKIERVSVSAHLDMDPVEMRVPGLFEKKKGVPTSVDISVIATEQEVKIEKIFAQFFNLEMTLQGSVMNLISSGGASSSPVFNLNLKSNEVRLQPWVELLPFLNGFNLGGTASVEGDVRGLAEKLNYHAQISVRELTAQAPQLKSQPKIDVSLKIATDQIESFLFFLRAPGNDLRIRGRLFSFSKPHATVEVSSTGMDLDELVVFPPSAKKEKTEVGAFSKGGVPQKANQSSVASGEDWDSLLAPLRQNPVLVNTAAIFTLKMPFLKAKGVKLSDIACQLKMKDLTVGLDSCGFKVFSGAVGVGTQVQLKPKTPSYQWSMKVVGLDMAKAVESQAALFKNTVMGLASFSMSGQGSSLNPDTALLNLKANGNLKVEKAVFSTIDVGKMASEALTKTLTQVGEKIPALKGKSLGNVPATGSKYEFISSDFQLASGKFSAPNFYAKSMPQQGIDLKGSTTVGMQDYSLDANWDVIDTYNLTHARDLSIEQAGVRVDSILAEGSSPVHFPVHVGCTLFAPCYSYTQVAGELIRVALHNVSTAAGNRAKEEVKKQAESVIKQVAPPQIQEKLKGFFR